MERSGRGVMDLAQNVSPVNLPLRLYSIKRFERHERIERLESHMEKDTEKSSRESCTYLGVPRRWSDEINPSCSAVSSSNPLLRKVVRVVPLI
jgi:hypothetical protein